MRKFDSDACSLALSEFHPQSGFIRAGVSTSIATADQS